MSAGDNWVNLGKGRYALDLGAGRGCVLEANDGDGSGGIALVYLPGVLLGQLIERNGGIDLAYDAPPRDHNAPDEVHEKAWDASELAANHAALNTPGTVKEAARAAYDAEIEKWRDSQPPEGDG